MYVCDVQVTGPNLQTRCYHSATAISQRPGLTEVLLFGGIPEVPEDAKSFADCPVIADTTVLTFGESTAWPVSPMHMLVHVVLTSMWGICVLPSGPAPPPNIQSQRRDVKGQQSLVM